MERFEEIPLDNNKLLFETIQNLDLNFICPSFHSVIDQFHLTDICDAARAIGALFRAGGDVDEIRDGQCVILRLLQWFKKSQSTQLHECIRIAMRQSRVDYEFFFGGVVLEEMKVLCLDLYMEWIILHRSEVQAVEMFDSFCDNVRSLNYVPRLIPVCLERTFLYLTEKLIDCCDCLDPEIYLGLFRTAVRTGNQATVEFVLNKLYQKVVHPLSLLIATVQEVINVKEENREGYNRCFDYILQKADVNQVEPHTQDTALYYACKYDDDYIIHRLINANAKLTKRNARGELAIEYISNKALKQYFDSCISPRLKFFRHDTTTLQSDGKVFFDLNAFGDAESSSEVALLSLMTRKKHLNNLLCHPLSRAFVALKWKKFRPYLYLHQQCPILSVVVAIIISITAKVGIGGLDNPITWIIWLIGIVSALAELIRLAISGVRYFKSVTNYLNIITLSIPFIYLMFPGSGRYATRIRYYTLGGGSILFALNITILMFYWVSKEIGIYLIMLIKVAINSLKFLASISFIIVGFSLSFYFVFGGKDELWQSNSLAQDGINNFTNVGISTFKTFVMITGELDAADLQYDNFMCYVITVIFIFLIPIVSLNLLNGLAVDDIQHIRRTAEFYCLMIYVAVLCEFEHLSASDITKFVCLKQPIISTAFRQRISNNMMKLLHTEIPLARIYVDLSTGQVLVFDSKLDMLGKTNARDTNYRLSSQILELTERVLLNKSEKY